MKNFITLFLVVMSLGFSAYGLEFSPDNNRLDPGNRDSKYIARLRFSSKTLAGQVFAGVNEIEWNHLEIVMTFKNRNTDQNTDTKQIICGFDEAGIAYPQGQVLNDPDPAEEQNFHAGYVNKAGSPFAFIFDIFDQQGNIKQCMSLANPGNKPYANMTRAEIISNLQPEQIQDIRISSSSDVNLGIESMNIEAVFNDLSHFTLYENRDVYAYIQYKVANSLSLLSSYPDAQFSKPTDCAADAAHYGFKKYNDNFLGGWDSAGTGNYIAMSAADRTVVFSRDDKEVLIKLKTADEADAGSLGLLSWSFEPKINCTDTARRLDLFSIVWKNTEKQAMFYLNGAVGLDELVQTSLYNNSDNDPITLISTMVRVKACWADDATTSRTEWIINDKTSHTINGAESLAYTFNKVD